MKMRGIDVMKIAKKEGRIDDKKLSWFVCSDESHEAFSKFFEENPSAGTDIVLSNYACGYTKGFRRGLLEGSIAGAVFATLGCIAADIFFGGDE